METAHLLFAAPFSDCKWTLDHALPSSSTARRREEDERDGGLELRVPSVLRRSPDIRLEMSTRVTLNPRLPGIEAMYPLPQPASGVDAPFGRRSVKLLASVALGFALVKE